MQHLRIDTRIIRGAATATGLVAYLVRRSMWFSFEPLPDDEYEIQVKAEAVWILDNFIIGLDWARAGDAQDSETEAAQ